MSANRTDDHPRLLDRVAGHGDRLAVVDPDGDHTYATIQDDAVRIAAALLTAADQPTLDGARVAILCRPGREFVGALLGCWLAGGLAVPLHPEHPVPELRYVVEDAEAEVLLHSDAHGTTARALVAEVPPLRSIDVVSARSGHDAPDPVQQGALPHVPADRAAVMVYTSGTTGRPKGAVHTHASLQAMVTGMVEAWGWQTDDRLPLVLPLNHVHGLVNVVLTSLWVGATCEAPGRFDAVEIWERFASGDVTVFMAVPTVYARLVAACEAADQPTRERWSAGARSLRLMVSGSAALPVATLERWEQLTGHRLLERYGMTELGMVLTNRLDHRVPGHVGRPFPGVEVRSVDDNGRDVDDGAAGELWVRGPQVFREYWGRPDATAEAFTDGWFRTGDIAVDDGDDGYRLLGRASVDIIKTGGEKVSALEIEELFRSHPAIGDCAVVGVADDEWGQRVAIAMVPIAPGTTTPPDPDELRAWGKERLATAKVPSRWRWVDDLPRNTLGKVTKRDVAALLDATPAPPSGD